MNLWRWFGALFLVIGAACLLSSQLPVHAGGDKKEPEKTKKDEGKKEEAKKDEGKKEETKKEDVKAPAGGALTLSAFDGKKPPMYQELKTTTIQKITVQGQEVNQNQDQTFIVQWTPEDKDKDGNYVVKQQILAVIMKIDIGGNKIAIDTNDPKLPKNPMTDFFQAMLKKDLKFTISPDLKVLKIDGRDDFVTKLSDTNPQMATLLKLILSENALRNMAEPTWWALPPAGAEKGKTWEKSNKLDLGPIGTYNTNFKFTYEGTNAAKLDDIKIDTNMTYAPPTDKKTGLPFTIKAANLKSTSGTGNAKFNREKGRFESSEVNTVLSGTLTIEVGNQETQINLTQDQKSTVKTLDQNPVAEPTKK